MQVSVVIPVRNAEPFLREAVRSALVQPQTAQVVLIEGGSTDGSLAVCEELANGDARVKVLREPEGVTNGAGARNMGIEQSTSEFVAFLDADDYFLPGRFDAATRAFAADPTVDGVYDAVGNDYEDESARAWWLANHSVYEVTTLHTQVAPTRLFEELVIGAIGWFCTDGVVVRKSLFDRCGVFDAEIGMASDTALWLRMAATGRLVGGSLVEPVAMRRVHATNTIRSQQVERPRSANRMWLHLLDWARSEQLPSARFDLLAGAHVRHWWTNSYPHGKFWAWRKLRIAAFLGWQAARRPALIRTTAFWRLARRLAPRGPDVASLPTGR